MDYLLDTDDLERLTGRKRKRAQCEALRQMGVKFAVRLDGQPIVTTDAVKRYTGMDDDATEAPKKMSMNFG